MAISFWISSKVYKSTPYQIKFVSVIIAARNEERKIIDLLHCLDQQTYPKHLLEIILINDHSEDKTAKLITDFKSISELKIRLLNLETRSSTPKKDALRLGIQNSNADILLFTDADCCMPATWVGEMIKPFRNNEIQLAIGSIRYEDGNFLEQLLSQEQAALLGSGLASLKIGIPTMCNGANMAIRRSVYDDVNGFETAKKAASGDDELLLHKVFAQHPKSVAFVRSNGSIVTTDAVTTLKALFQQRKRWAGKWEKYLLYRTKAFALFIFLFHVFWISAGILVCFYTEYLNQFLISLAIKIVLEFVFITSVMKFLGKRINLLGFGVLQIIYSPYVVFFGLISRGKNYSWKGRELN